MHSDAGRMISHIQGQPRLIKWVAVKILNRNQRIEASKNIFFFILATIMFHRKETNKFCKTILSYNVYFPRKP